MVNERGTKKWTSLMLPEHVQMLEELNKEQDRKEKPIIDEQMMAENYLMLREALEFDYKLQIEYYTDFNYRIEEGYLLSVDGVNGIVFIEEINIKFDDIIEVNLF